MRLLMKFIPLSILMVGMIGLTGCGGSGSSSGSNQTADQTVGETQSNASENENTTDESKVEDQVIGYEFSYSGDGSNISIYEQAVENETLLEKKTNLVGNLSKRGYEYPVLTADKKFKLGTNVVDNKTTYFGLKVAELTSTLLSTQSLDDTKLVSSITFATHDISGKKITDVLAFSGDFKKALDSLPSTQNTFGTQQSCKYNSAETSGIDYMEYDEVFKENATLNDLKAQAASFLTDKTVSGQWLGKSWIVNVNKEDGEAWANGLVLDNGTIYNVDFYPKGKTDLVFNGCETFTKEQADFIANAIKLAS